MCLEFDKRTFESETLYLTSLEWKLEGSPGPLQGYALLGSLKKAEFALEELTLTQGLKNKYVGYAPHQEWRPETKFENKGLKAERKISELFFEKI